MREKGDIQPVAASSSTSTSASSTKTTERPPTVNVNSFDADGCLFNPQFIKSESETPQKIIDSNASLLKAIREKNKNYEYCVTFVGSNRQSESIDQMNSSKSHGSCSIISAIPAVSQYTGSDLDTFLISDAQGLLGCAGNVTYRQQHAGYSFEMIEKKLAGNPVTDKNGKIYPHADCCMDGTKAIILYAQMHRTALRYPDGVITFNFYDDRRTKQNGSNDILEQLYHFFSQYPQLIPENTTLNLYHYEGDDVSLVHHAIDGKGIIDMNYKNTITTMCEVTFKRRNWNLSEFFPQEIQVTEHVKPEDLSSSVQAYQPGEEISEDIKIDLASSIRTFMKANENAIAASSALSASHTMFKQLPQKLVVIFWDNALHNLDMEMANAEKTKTLFEKFNREGHKLAIAVRTPLPGLKTDILMILNKNFGRNRSYLTEENIYLFNEDMINDPSKVDVNHLLIQHIHQKELPNTDVMKVYSLTTSKTVVKSMQENAFWNTVRIPISTPQKAHQFYITTDAYLDELGKQVAGSQAKTEPELSASSSNATPRLFTQKNKQKNNENAIAASSALSASHTMFKQLPQKLVVIFWDNALHNLDMEMANAEKTKTLFEKLNREGHKLAIAVRTPLQGLKTDILMILNKNFGGNRSYLTEENIYIFNEDMIDDPSKVDVDKILIQHIHHNELPNADVMKVYSLTTCQEVVKSMRENAYWNTVQIPVSTPQMAHQFYITTDAYLDELEKQVAGNTAKTEPVVETGSSNITPG